MTDSNMGHWANGEPIDISGLPLEKVLKIGAGATLVYCVAAANGGMFDAIYTFVDKRGDERWVYELARVEETLPPSPPQTRGYGDDIRLRMPTEAEEVQQRKKEWAEALQVHGGS